MLALGLTTPHKLCTEKIHAATTPSLTVKLTAGIGLRGKPSAPTS